MAIIQINYSVLGNTLMMTMTMAVRILVVRINVILYLMRTGGQIQLLHYTFCHCRPLI